MHIIAKAKHLIPLSLKRFLKRLPLIIKSRESIFTEYYKNNKWGDSSSRSGSGSNLDQTLLLRQSLPQIFSTYKIKSILDIPCGDFHWFQTVKLSEKMTYTGADIVQDLIEKNENTHSKQNVRFQKLDITSDSLPCSDIIIVRDCFIHLSFADIKKALTMIKKSQSTYLLTTYFFDCVENVDIPTGSFRRINLTIKPFNFPKPIHLIKEGCTESNGKFYDKSMGLWRLDQLYIENFK